MEPNFKEMTQVSHEFLDNLEATKGEAFSAFVKQVARTTSAHGMICGALEAGPRRDLAAQVLQDLCCESLAFFAEAHKIGADELTEGMALGKELVQAVERAADVAH